MKNLSLFKIVFIIVGIILIQSCNGNDEFLSDYQNEFKINNVPAVESSVSNDENSKLAAMESELFTLRMKTRRFYNFQVAQAQGYVQATDYRTQMGIHFAKGTLFDDTFDLEHPEILLYIPNEDGEMEFVAVEYGVPIADINNPPPPPEGFSGDADVWEINTEFNLWTLHVWIAKENPDGIFTAKNPLLD